MVQLSKRSTITSNACINAHTLSTFTVYLVIIIRNLLASFTYHTQRDRQLCIVQLRPSEKLGDFILMADVRIHITISLSDSPLVIPSPFSKLVIIYLIYSSALRTTQRQGKNIDLPHGPFSPLSRAKLRMIHSLSTLSTLLYPLPSYENTHPSF